LPLVENTAEPAWGSPFYRGKKRTVAGFKQAAPGADCTAG